MKKLLKIIFLLSFFCVSAQQNDLDFREDQFFFSFSYPFFSNNPSDLIQNKFSYSYSLGFVRDFPINIKRTIALGIGLGFEKSVVYNNYKIYEDENEFVSTIIIDDYNQNFLSLSSIKIPFEFRWRSADEINHSFWRIYSGIGLKIPTKIKAMYSANGTEEISFLPKNSPVFDFNIAVGYNTWNIYFSTDLKSFTNEFNKNSNYDIKFTKIGLVFYVL